MLRRTVHLSVAPSSALTTAWMLAFRLTGPMLDCTSHPTACPFARPTHQQPYAVTNNSANTHAPPLPSPPLPNTAVPSSPWEPRYPGPPGSPRPHPICTSTLSNPRHIVPTSPDAGGERGRNLHVCLGYVSTIPHAFFPLFAHTSRIRRGGQRADAVPCIVCGSSSPASYVRRCRYVPICPWVAAYLGSPVCMLVDETEPTGSKVL
ncbi:uncharacterized protein IWZ02DRAFT_207880 [Phyllosticta citriasiana]|uniref:Secreted protein n=1 Tax=Phyllosticta citriasiana TaxID=595635 RepID=A0ABR1KN08_9PEZI